jgi:hypothetical protein
MKHVNVYVLAALLGLAGVASANPLADSHDNNSVNATATGGSNRTDVDTSVKTDVDVRNSANSGSFSGASSNQKQGQLQGQNQGQEQGINAFNGNTTIVNPGLKSDVKYDGRTHAESAPESRGMTTGSDTTVCGAVGGASAQTGIFGGGISSESFACLATKHSVYQAADHSQFDRVVEDVSWYLPPFLVFRMVRSAIFN